MSRDTMIITVLYSIGSAAFAGLYGWDFRIFCIAAIGAGAIGWWRAREDHLNG